MFKNKIMIFKEPIILKEGFRVIPNYVRYSADEYGNILDSETNEILKPHTVSDFYPTVYIHDVRVDARRRIGIHRLMALAWCDNDNLFTKLVVNHKDGDKYNCFKDNLEWATYTENALHAFQNGLRTDNIPCTLRSIITGEIREYFSMGDMARDFGLSRARDPSFYSGGPVTRLHDKEWEVRVQGDDRPWHYKIGDKPVPRSRYITTVSYPDGKKEVYWDNRDIIKKFKCWNVNMGIDAVIAKARELHPELVFEIEDRWKDRIVQTLNVETMEVVDESPWVTNATKFMNCSRGAVDRLLRLGEQRPKNGYAVRYKPKEEAPWKILSEDYIGQPVRIRVTDTRTNEIKVFDSLREIERELKVSRFVSKKRLDTGIMFGHYLFNTEKVSPS